MTERTAEAYSIGRVSRAICRLADLLERAGRADLVGFIRVEQCRVEGRVAYRAWVQA